APPALRSLTTIAACLLTVQIILGGLVSSTYAGLACPDWPTCMNGAYFPSWSGAQGLHLFHRLVGYGCLFAIAIAAASARNFPGAKTWLATAAVFALLQVVVGITNVLLRLPVEVTGLHSALAAGLICSMGVAVYEVWRGTRTKNRDSAAPLSECYGENHATPSDI
ncbi:MAG: COX15/CtaA family protein, partial [Myxococcota bacterium]